jgi:hypothetical protein
MECYKQSIRGWLKINQRKEPLFIYRLDHVFYIVFKIILTILFGLNNLSIYEWFINLTSFQQHTYIFHTIH